MFYNKIKIEGPLLMLSHTEDLWDIVDPRDISRTETFRQDDGEDKYKIEIHFKGTDRYNTIFGIKDIGPTNEIINIIKQAKLK
jgi:hypothetical protein